MIADTVLNFEVIHTIPCHLSSAFSLRSFNEQQLGGEYSSHLHTCFMYMFDGMRPPAHVTYCNPNYAIWHACRSNKHSRVKAMNVTTPPPKLTSQRHSCSHDLCITTYPPQPTCLGGGLDHCALGSPLLQSRHYMCLRVRYLNWMPIPGSTGLAKSSESKGGMETHTLAGISKLGQTHMKTGIDIGPWRKTWEFSLLAIWNRTHDARLDGR